MSETTRSRRDGRENNTANGFRIVVYIEKYQIKVYHVMEMYLNYYK